MYVNVTKSTGDDRAFILYIGNEDDTHKKLPGLSLLKLFLAYADRLFSKDSISDFISV
jgi:hypothetical protein